MSARHWTEPVQRILSSNTDDLRALALLGGFDPTTFYRDQDLSGCDLRGQDLTGMDLSGCNLEKAILDRATKIDDKFDPRIEKGDDYWTFTIPIELNSLVLNFIRDYNYVYSAWAHRRLIEKAIRALLKQEYTFYEELIRSNSSLSRIISDKKIVNQVPVRVLLYSAQIAEVERWLGRSLTPEDGRWMMLVGLLAFKVSPRDKRDYSHLSANAFYPSKLMRIEGALPRDMLD